jgi:glucose-6-phosphate isomerase
MPDKPSFSTSQYEEYSGDFQNEFEKVLPILEALNFPERIQNSDYTLWSKSPNEIVNRLGWLQLPESMGNNTERILKFSEKISAENFKTVVLLGMGGSSLAPEMFASSFKTYGPLNITVLDSTDPDYILSVRKKLELTSTIIIVSSKSGSTVETVSLMNYFLDEYSKELEKEEIGKHFVAITDPGSDLESWSKKLNFRDIFLNNPNIGGRFSALSYFGLVPASLTGLDLNKFIKRSQDAAHLSQINDISLNIALRLGALMGSLSEKGLNKLTIFTSDEISCFKFWVEQLVAESTGKNGKGILPVPEESFNINLDYGKDRVYIYIKLIEDVDAEKEIKSILKTGQPLVIIELEDLYDLGKQIFLWEYATAVAGHYMLVNPFDQPDVESAKIFTKNFVKYYRESGVLEKKEPRFQYENLDFYSDSDISGIESFPEWLRGNAVEGSYISIQAYITPAGQTELKINELAKKLSSEYKIPVTTGFGPRYLHSSGQLHKGDTGKGIFIQLTADIVNDIPIPDEPFSKNSSLNFGILKNAQALGDYGALSNKGRNIVSINLTSNVNSDLQKLIMLF